MRPGCLGYGTPRSEAVCLRLFCFLGWGVAAVRLRCDFCRLGNSWWVGMLQCLASEECSPLSINLAFQQSWGPATQSYSLLLFYALLSSSCLLRGRPFLTPRLLRRYKRRIAQHINLIFKRYPLEKN